MSFARDKIGTLVTGIASVVFVILLFYIKNHRPDLDEILKSFANWVTEITAFAIGYLFWRFLRGLLNEARTYAKNISRRDTDAAWDFDLYPEFRSTRAAKFPVARNDEETIGRPIEPPALEPTAIDSSTPDKLFQVSRQRLLDEAVRIDSISHRNLGIGITFSVIALGVLAWPLVSRSFLPTAAPTDGMFASWGMRYYLPRFSIGLLLQFVGFFFLRLYAANELDLKHDKNELTNVEMKMMALQLADIIHYGPEEE